MAAQPDRKLADLCTLSPDELTERRAWVEREIAPHALRRVGERDAVTWEFSATDETRERLERLAQLEAQCCGPAALEVSVTERDGVLRFAIRGPDAAVLARMIEGAEARASSERGCC
jgi:hypothetical protein